MRAILLLTSLSTVICVLTPALSGTTWYVDAGVASPGDGKSWDTAFKKAQEGIDATENADEVVVAQGTRQEHLLQREKHCPSQQRPLECKVVSTKIIHNNGFGSVGRFSSTKREKRGTIENTRSNQTRLAEDSKRLVH